MPDTAGKYASDDRSRFQTVLSASRRTDIPAFYIEWFLSCLDRGSFSVENPFSKQTRTLEFRPEDIHSIVFWSKNYAPLLASKQALEDYNCYFHFTINSPVPVLEPAIPPLASRFDQVRALAGWRGPDKLMWRFDPIVIWEEGGHRKNNLCSFEHIAETLSKTGVHRLTMSVMDRYRKIDLRIRRKKGFEFVYPEPAESREILEPLIEHAVDRGFEVSLCCEKELVKMIDHPMVKKGKCIDGELLTRLFGAGADLSPDRGQRRSSGCGCSVSFDVGSYTSQPCLHNCLYCYANPARTAPAG
jgi:hypothetical protein